MTCRALQSNDDRSTAVRDGGVSAIVLLIGLLIGCQRSDVASNGQRAQAKEPVSFFISCDTQGWIVPCGCSAGQSGGLLRRATLVKRLTDGSVKNSFVMDVGGAGAGTSNYHQMKFSAIIDGELSMGLDVHNIGAAEAALGPQKLVTRHKSRVPFISTNVKTPDGLDFVPNHSQLVVADQTFLVVGVMDPKFSNEKVSVIDPYEAVLDAIETEQHDGVIVLAYMDRAGLMQLAKQLPEVDVIIGGPTGQTIAPTRQGATLVLSATNKGKFIAQVDYRPDQSPRWSGSIIEVDDTYENDPIQIDNLATFHQRLAESDFDAMTTGLKRLSQFQFVADLKFAGNSTCVACHGQDCQQYASSKHAHAWQTLVDKGSHVDPYCQQCHTTGYGAPSGFRSIAQSPALVNVGCESCHGPSWAHVNAPKTLTPFNAKDQCARCHDHENSPNFQYAAYWSKIVHGQNKPTGQGKTNE